MMSKFNITRMVCIIVQWSIGGLILAFSFAVNADDDWRQTVKEAKGQTVYFNAWGGSETINDYIEWAGNKVKQRYGVTVKQVKVSDTANVVNRVLAEKAAGKDTQGSVDLVWINGENFKRMKENGLLLPSWTNTLPNYHLIDKNNPAALYDFSIPVDNQEAPWGKAQLVFMYDSKRLKNPPQSMADFAKVAKENPARLSYPAPPEFHGTTFLKQALSELITDKSALSKPVNQNTFAELTAPLWSYLDALHPNLWQKGRNFPKGIAEMKKMLADSELMIALSFNPNDASNSIENGELPNSVRTYVHKEGTIGNVHFVAIPFNSPNSAGAKIFANFLMSVEAQIRKANVKIWGDPTVLALNRLNQAERKRFQALPQGVATLTPKDLSKILPEPHPSWVGAIEKEWQKRYGS
jgi:putative thiamine transport system substrate-binding protein